MENNQKPNSGPVPHHRLVQPLPPLPLPLPLNLQLNDLPPRTQLSITTSIPYRDSPTTPTPFTADSDAQETLPNVIDETLKSPPGYEPMYDYLRNHSRPCTPAILEPYRDEPFIVTIIEGEEGHISISQPPPPSYNELFNRRQTDLEALIREFDGDGRDSPAEQTEAVVKWLAAMFFVGLTVACVGTAFNWGR